MRALLACGALAALSACGEALSDHVKNNVRANFGASRVLRLAHDAVTDDLRAALKTHDVDVFGSHELGVEIRLQPDAVRALSATGVQFEDRTEHWIAHFEENFRDENFMCMDGAEACAARDLQTFYQSYQTLDAYHARMDSLVASSGGLATTGTIGNSYQGRNMRIVHVGNAAKPEVFVQCNTHAREWLTPSLCIWILEHLLANGGHPLLNTFYFTILPSANPDGYTYTLNTDNMWRKTRKPNSGSSCVGTDPNRNWDDHHCGEGASTNPCDETYCGAQAFDQPETANVAAYANAHPGIFSFTDFHSYGGYWMSPLGWTYSYPPAADFNRMKQCFTAAAAAVKATHGLTFTIGSSANAIYIAAGGSDDWFYSAQHTIYANSVELRGSSFQPAASNIIPSNEEIFAGWVAGLNCAISIEFGTTSAPTPGSTPTVPPTVPPTTGTTPTRSPTTGSTPTVPPTAFPTPFPGGAPSSWTCNAAYYNAADGCDCACGDADPDCTLPNQDLYGCSSGRVCVNGVCSTVPSGWTCNSAYYAAVDGCDCKCGVPDPDCNIAGQTVYGCSSGQRCVNGLCTSSFMDRMLTNKPAKP